MSEVTPNPAFERTRRQVASSSEVCGGGPLNFDVRAHGT
jgi:hypothetical protein